MATETHAENARSYLKTHARVFFVRSIIMMLNMREQTRALKAILKKEFPETKFKLKYIPTYNCAFSSDRIVVEYTGEPSFEKIRAVLYNYIMGMTIYEHGGEGCRWGGGFVRNTIKNPELDEQIDGDLLEFIEIYQK